MRLPEVNQGTFSLTALMSSITQVRLTFQDSYITLNFTSLAGVFELAHRIQRTSLCCPKAQKIQEKYKRQLSVLHNGLGLLLNGNIDIQLSY